MQHISTERLAALADESPTPDEAHHLGHCLACRRERDEYVALLDLARREGSAGVEPGVLAAVGEPLTSWEGIAAGLRAQGLIDETLTTGGWRRPASPSQGGGAPAGGKESTQRPIVRRVAPTWWRQAAAASVLLVVGAAAGRATADAGLLSRFATSHQPSPAGASDAGTLTARITDPAATAFASISDAADALARAQRDYQRASAYLAVHDTSAFIGDSDALRTRLAALDELIPRVREALSDAPQDPVLNQYYQTTYDARETTLRQLGRTLPVGVRISGY
jgi:hypothetical protein